MKRSLFFVGMGAIALATPLFLSSCSSSDDATSETPTPYTGEAVKTSFTLSVGLPKGNGSNGAKAFTGTRMTDAEVQSTGNFRGIDNINLIPFAKTSAIASTDFRLGSNITLPASATNGNNNVYESSAAKGTDHATVYSNVTVPVGTASFLFYGKAIDNSAATAISSDADKHKFGTLSSEGLSGEPSAIKFSPVQIYTAGTADSKATALADYLTSIANTKITVDNADVSWSATNNANNTIYPLYLQFIKIETGSSASVRAALQTIYESLKLNTDAMSKAVIESIKKDGNATITNDVVTLKTDLQGFPGNLSTPIPDGCALVKWNSSTNKFEANLSGTSTSGQMTQKPSDLVYPANLQYYANTTLKTSDTDQSSAYDGTNTWSQILANYATGTAVGPTTRSVALTDQIQYAVGRLDVTVKGGASTLNDREGKAISLTNGSNPSFPISAVLVGGQKQVVYDFTPTTASNATEYTIYDNAVPLAWGTTGVGTDASAVNHTLVLANTASTSVNIAVEFTNNSGTEFVGKDGIIGKGAKFYLLATLDPSSATETEKAKTGSQVFKQDFTTTAKLTINANTGTTSESTPTYDKGLANAYNVLPDLRTPKLSLGMSVNLTWQTGMTFEQDFN